MEDFWTLSTTFDYWFRLNDYEKGWETDVKCMQMQRIVKKNIYYL